MVINRGSVHSLGVIICMHVYVHASMYTVDVAHIYGLCQLSNSTPVPGWTNKISVSVSYLAPASDQNTVTVTVTITVTLVSMSKNLMIIETLSPSESRLLAFATTSN